VTLPAQYADLAKEQGPRVLVEGLKTYGVREVPGPGNDPVIMGWVDEIVGAVPRLSGLTKMYSGDDVPWCGLWAGIVAYRAGFVDDIPTQLLSSRAWARFGGEADKPSLGDFLVFWRGSPESWTGHVGLYVGEDRTHYHVLGGNQSDAVNIMRIDKKRLVAARRCRWRIAQPKQVRPVKRAAKGAVSTNEA
jgi:uncharacterized protein (TIGR02594 family)